ncbi:unnamed protein product [Bathycoccus prasinos]
MMKPFLFSWVMLSLWFFAFVWNEYKPFRLNKMFVSLSLPEDYARDVTFTFFSLLVPIAVVMNERLNAFEQRRRKMVDDSDENGKNKTQISKVKVFIALQAMKFWYVFRKVHGNMPWVLYRERKLAIERELESEMRSFEAKAFDGKNMGMWSKQKHKNARRSLVIWRRSREVVNGYEENVKKLEQEVEDVKFPEDMMVGGDRENCLRRYLSSTKNSSDVYAAKRMIVNSMDWREKMKPREYLRRWTMKEEDGGMSELEKKVHKAHPCMSVYTTHTPLGIPVCCMRVGDASKNMMTMSAAEYNKKSGRNAVIVHDKCVVVIDASKDIALKFRDGKQLKAKQRVEMFKNMMIIFRQQYPDLIYKFYVVNASLNVRVFWHAVSGFLDSQMRKKVTMFGRITGEKKSKAAFEEIVDVFGGIDRTPTFLGGTCERKLSECGPWVVKDLHSDNAFRGWEREDEVDEKKQKKKPNASPLRVTGSFIYRGVKKVASFTESQPTDLSAVAKERRASYIREHTV